MSQYPRLNASVLNQFDRTNKPRYDRSSVTSGIVHIGVGGFHRAHQAVYTDDVLNDGATSWGISGVNLRSESMRQSLAPQDLLYTVMTRPASGTQPELRVIGSLCDLYAANTVAGAASVATRIAADLTQVVTFTVTEKGYCLDQNATLDVHHVDINHDLNTPGEPHSMPGLIARALAQRARQDGAPLTLLSCDNLSNNGAALRGAVFAMIAELYPEAQSWVSDNVSFPASMVDRIVPQTTPEDFAEFSRLTGMEDRGLVTCEPFRQWVIGADFAGERPPWDIAGAQFVTDVAAFETAKLRLLNAAHSTLAHLGLLAGYEFVHKAVADGVLKRFVRTLFEQEIVPTLKAPAGLDLGQYTDEILNRFANHHVPYTTLQVASDGSQKLIQRIFPTIIAQLEHSHPPQLDRLCLVVAAWIQTLTGTSDATTPISVVDPQAQDLADWLQTQAAGLTASEVVRYVADQTDHFGGLASNARFLESLAQALENLRSNGAIAAAHSIVRHST